MRTSFPLVPTLPKFLFARYFRKPVFFSTDIGHLRYPWRPDLCHSRCKAVTFTRLRCGIPFLSFSLHRIGFKDSALCVYFNVTKTIAHFLYHAGTFLTIISFWWVPFLSRPFHLIFPTFYHSEQVFLGIQVQYYQSSFRILFPIRIVFHNDTYIGIGGKIPGIGCQ